MLGWSDVQGLICVFANTKLENTVIMLLFVIFLNNFSIANHISDILADKHSLREVFICYYIIAHTFSVNKSEWTKRLFLVLLIDLLFEGIHLHQPEIKTLLIKVFVEWNLFEDVVLTEVHFFCLDGVVQISFVGLNLLFRHVGVIFCERWERITSGLGGLILCFGFQGLSEHFELIVSGLFGGTGTHFFVRFGFGEMEIEKAFKFGFLFYLF